MDFEKMLGRSVFCVTIPGKEHKIVASTVKTMRDKMPDHDMLMLSIETVEALLIAPDKEG